MNWSRYRIENCKAVNVLTSQGLELLATTEHGRVITITPPLCTLGDICIIYLMGSRTFVPREVPVTPVALKMMIRRVRAWGAKHGERWTRSTTNYEVHLCVSTPIGLFNRIGCIHCPSSSSPSDRVEDDDIVQRGVIITTNITTYKYYSLKLNSSLWNAIGKTTTIEIFIFE